MKIKLLIILAVFLTFPAYAQMIQDSKQKAQIAGQKSSEMGNETSRQGIDEALAGILDNLGKIGIPVLAFLKELLASPAEPEVPGISETAKEDPAVAKAGIRENMQLPDDTSKVNADQMKSVRENQTTAEKELGMTGLANSWVYSMNAAQFPSEAAQQGQRIAEATTEKDMITALSMTTVQLARESVILIDTVAQAIQSSAIQYNVGDSVRIPQKGTGGNK